MKFEKSCGAVVYKVVSGVTLFLIEHMALGHTSLPKGHMEKGETEEETAIREIKEETNLDVVLDTRFRHTISYSPYPGIEKTVVFFAAEAASDSLVNQECEVSALEWMPYEQACLAFSSRYFIAAASVSLSSSYVIARQACSYGIHSSAETSHS